MATRAVLGYQYEDGTIEAIMLDLDGYIENAGNLLAKHYQEPDQARALIKAGDIEILTASVKTNRRGENGGSVKVIADHEYGFRCLMDKWDASFSYLYKNGKWYVSPSVSIGT